MRIKKPCLLITFATTTQAMAFEAFCIENGMEGRLIPVPEKVRAGCGLAWKSRPEQVENFMKVTKEQGLRYESMCEVEL